ncbi:hypothetical protein [Croceicoccus sp. BE223]|uniref:hypothetical protein n=1 Tax=Croceicoccus sp. BE223 TaxID=2817716 RepID=UPI002854290A|nr:hypothetical protein [Croceicoccus sp. BE223]MDR7102489.1 hypothetical protein [Croceicoccus sp. BE223]
MIETSGQALDLWQISGRDHPAHVADHRLVECEVMGTMLASPHPGEWRTIRHCEAVGCRQYNCSLAGTAIEDCLLDTMGQAGPMYLTLDACVFRRVIMRGRLTTMLFRFDPHPFSGTGGGPDFKDRWRAEMAAYYRSGSRNLEADWALDITEARFTALTSLTIVPGELVRFDPDRAIRIRRDALTGNWAEEMPGVMQICCEDFLEGPFDSFVVQRGESKVNRERFAREAAWMRDHGFADPA